MEEMRASVTEMKQQAFFEARLDSGPLGSNFEICRRGMSSECLKKKQCTLKNIKFIL